jgi:carbamoyltransferase
MKILGISDGMTGGAAILEEGRVTFAVHEERLTRAKMAVGFPRQSITMALKATGTDPREIGAVAVATVNEFLRDPPVAYDGWLLRDQSPVKELLLQAASSVTRLGGSASLLKRSYYELKSVLGRARRKTIRALLRDEWGLGCPVEFVDHHFAHACSAYYTNCHAEATVITMDGAGDNQCSHVYRVRDGVFERLWTIDSFDSIGNYYAYATHLCGFTAQKHEGKITGLAAYGQPEYLDLLRRFVTYQDGSTVNIGRVFYWSAVKALSRALPRGFRREDLAASAQRLLEEVCSTYVDHWVRRTGCADLAVAGGVFANVKLNQRLHELPAVRSLFIHPGMGDEGLAVGAGYAVTAALGQKRGLTLTPRRLPDVLLGPDYRDEEAARAIQEEGLEIEPAPDVERRAAELLAQGRVVARAAGRMEYGPRALGNRSLLFQPTDPSVNDWLNKRLRRTEFMPFAPVTPAESADQCYRNLDGARYAAEFMTITFECTPWLHQHCPAVVHVDGTARPQLIHRDTNPRYYRILEEYRKLTGLPVLINTSFNMHEEPIVCTPRDALRAFVQGGLDYLLLGDRLVRCPASNRPAPA